MLSSEHFAIGLGVDILPYTKERRLTFDGIHFVQKSNDEMKNPIVKMTLTNVCEGDRRAHIMSPFCFSFLPNSQDIPSASGGDVLRPMVKP